MLEGWLEQWSEESVAGFVWEVAGDLAGDQPEGSCALLLQEWSVLLPVVLQVASSAKLLGLLIARRLVGLLQASE